MAPVVVLGFDMETDIGSWTPFYEGLVHGTPRVLDILAEQGVKATFYFTGDAAKSHPEVVKTVQAAGHEVGCHSLYHETLGDEIIPIPGLKPVLPEECYHRVGVATEIVEEVVGHKVVSFRAPRLWGSNAMLCALEDHGYLTDASYPMYYFEDRLTPYHPDRDDWTAEGGMTILEIPNFADMTIESGDEFGRDRDQWPLFRTVGAAALMEHVDNMLALYEQRGLDAVLCFYLHPWEFQEMPQGLIHFGEGAVKPDEFIVKNCGDVAVRELGKVVSMLKDRKAEFCTAGALAERYRV